VLQRAGARPVLLEVAEDNPAAIALYGNTGFAVVGRRPAYYRRQIGPAVAALALRRPAAV
jgi:ribosomal-protein-alanine N-acetyltransferase